jgi:5-oxoprolinase (ATP-hydrolysing)
MVAFGGAGPAFAADVARSLGVREVIVPPASGAASALGFLAAPLSFENARSNPMRLGVGFDAATANAILDALEAEGRNRLAEAGQAGALMVERSADMRLHGQLHEIAVPLPAGVIGAESAPGIRAAFAEVYQRRYASVFAGAEIEIISFRVRVAAPAPALPLSLAGTAARGAALKGERRIAIGGASAVARVYEAPPMAIRRSPLSAAPRASGSTARRSSRRTRQRPGSRLATACRSMPPARWCWPSRRLSA